MAGDANASKAKYPRRRLDKRLRIVSHWRKPLGECTTEINEKELNKRRLLQNLPGAPLALFYTFPEYTNQNTRPTTKTNWPCLPQHAMLIIFDHATWRHAQDSWMAGDDIRDQVTGRLAGT